MLLNYVSVWSAVFWIQSSNSSRVSPSQESEVVYFAVKYQVCVLPRRWHCLQRFESPHLPVLCQQELDCVCAGPERIPEVIGFLMSPVCHTKVAFKFWGN